MPGDQSHPRRGTAVLYPQVGQAWFYVCKSSGRLLTLGQDEAEVDGTA